MCSVFCTRKVNLLCPAHHPPPHSHTKFLRTYTAGAKRWGGRGALLPPSLPHTYSLCTEQFRNQQRYEKIVRHTISSNTTHLEILYCPVILSANLCPHPDHPPPPPSPPAPGGAAGGSWGGSRGCAPGARVGNKKPTQKNPKHFYENNTNFSL
jgi:hypothetical protein